MTFLPGHIGGGLVLKLTIVIVPGFLSNFCRLCALSAEMGKFSRRGITSIYKVSLFQKKKYYESINTANFYVADRESKRDTSEF